MALNDTIVALSTPAGESALALIRLSGPLCGTLVTAVFNHPTPLSRQACLAEYRDLEERSLDTVIYVFYEEGASFTGDATLEISCHGNPLIIQKITEDLIQRECRMAEPGEFTRTAFLNGRMDLSQAEAVIDLIRARSDKALEVAKNQLDGSVRNKIISLTDSLLQVIAHFEAYIDFPEEDLPPEDEEGPLRELNLLRNEMERMIATGQYSTLLHDGVKTVIVGQPNVGKSSLLNALIGRERAIVSVEPGTTRDYIEERVIIDSHFLRVIDTAGFHESSSAVEHLGMKKTREQLESADFKLLVIDSTVPSPQLPDDVLPQIVNGATLVIENKIDLPDSQRHTDFIPDLPHCRVSALTGEGIKEAETVIIQLLKKDVEAPTEDTVIVSVRHAHALREAKTHLHAALQKIEKGDAPELIVSDLRSSMGELSEITGKIDNEAMLDKLFQSFCIGK